MAKRMYLTAEEVGTLLGISRGHAYRLIKGMNEDLRKKGYVVIAGRVPTLYFEEKVYGASRCDDYDCLVASV